MFSQYSDENGMLAFFCFKLRVTGALGHWQMSVRFEKELLTHLVFVASPVAVESSFRRT